MNKYYDYIIIGIYVYFTFMWCILSLCSIMMKKDNLKVTSKRYKSYKFVKNVSTIISVILLLLGLLAYQDNRSSAMYLIYIIVMIISLILLVIPLPYTFILVYVLLDRFMKYKSDKHRVLYNSLIALPIAFVLFGSITGAVGYYTINPLIEYMINYY